MYELTLPNIDIVTNNQEIELIGYEVLDRQLNQLGEYLSSIVVTQDNIKENKHLVAKVRKACKELNDRRIAFKREYLKPLETLENQVKQLDKKASEFENLVRVQIRDLEEKEREEKRAEIENLFNKRLKIYGSSELYPFESFLTKQHLNKSTSMEKIEDEMVEWFESRQNDINALISYSESIPQDKDTVIAQYLNLEDLSKTINYFTEHNAKTEQVRKARESVPKRANKPQPKSTVLIRIAEEDLERVKQLLELSQINFELT